MAHRISTAAARKEFANVVRKSSRGERIKLTRYDKTQAVLISKDDLDILEKCEAASRRARRKR
jgi:prevent-host-death family protein